MYSTASGSARLTRGSECAARLSGSRLTAHGSQLSICTSWSLVSSMASHRRPVSLPSCVMSDLYKDLVRRQKPP